VSPTVLRVKSAVDCPVGMLTVAAPSSPTATISPSSPTLRLTVSIDSGAGFAVSLKVRSPPSVTVDVTAEMVTWGSALRVTTTVYVSVELSSAVTVTVIVFDPAFRATWWPLALLPSLSAGVIEATVAPLSLAVALTVVEDTSLATSAV